ncbi:MAG: 4-hydroxy-tetrahydrodipicolinate synthase [Bacillota bacterium]|jgi:4-hydroxy-tetrahydrodipicolinate synthase|nr:4-hydroxy-tetrahydrodipicolinate synthase [Bacillota bacterium]
MKDFGRVLTAMVTPFTENGEVAYEQAATLARHLIKTGSDGIVVSGTTGESPVLTKEEKGKLFAVVKEAAGDQATVIAGTGSNDTRASIELTKIAEKTGVDGIMLVTPYYNKPSQEGLYQHFKAIAQETSLPIIVYNVPGRTSVNLLPGTLVRLAEIDNIVAVKEASGNLDQVAEIKRTTPQNFIIYSGDDSLTLPMLALGCYGVISVASHVAGKLINKMINSFVAGKIEEAKEIHLKIFPLLKVLFITTNPVPVKAAVKLIGIDAGPPRLPLVEATVQEVEAIGKVMKELKLID